MIQVIHRAFDILEYIAQDRTRLYTLGEIASHLKLNNATCANIIKTIVYRGYLVQEGRKKGYRLGPKSYFLTGNYLYKKELLSVATEPMKRLSALLNEGCVLAVLKDNLRAVLLEITSTHDLQVIDSKEKDAYLTATGRMILACKEDKEQREYIRMFGLPSPDAWPGIVDEDDLMLKLHIIRKKQIVVQASKGWTVGSAVPIYKDNKVVASLGIHLPHARFTNELQVKIEAELLKTKEEINLKLNVKNSNQNRNNGIE